VDKRTSTDKEQMVPSMFMQKYQVPHSQLAIV